MPKYRVKSGQSHTLILDYPKILFEDAVLGPHANRTIDLKYADGFHSQGVTDENGWLKVSVDHGEYIDTTINLEDGKIECRLFVCFNDSSITIKAWKLLVNLGYVREKKPPLEPTSKEIMTAALEEFQSDHNINITGKLDNITWVRLDKYSKDETPRRDHEWITEEDLNFDIAGIDRDSVT